ncbi:MAG: Uma2 family endonuclease [Thermomicrobiales bacterium]
MVAATLLNRPLTFADIADLPDDGMRHELIGGELYMTPAPSTKHQRVVGRLFRLLSEYVEQRNIGEVIIAPFDVHFDDFNVVEPDIIVVGSSSAGTLDDAGLQGPPSLCVEVLSPGTRGLDLVKKHLLYARFGVPEYWVVDPDLEQITVSQIIEGKYVAVESADGVARSLVFPGLLIDPAGISSPPGGE